MIAVRVMQMAVDEIVDVVAMWHSIVAASGAMLMTGLVAGALVVGRTLVGVLARHLDHVLIDMIAVHVMQVAVMQVIDVIAMTHCSMAATRAMLMCVIGMMGF